jgi:hypothetical protein
VNRPPIRLKSPDYRNGDQVGGGGFSLSPERAGGGAKSCGAALGPAAIGDLIVGGVEAVAGDPAGGTFATGD